MARNDPLLERIEAYREKQGGGVIIRRANKGYSLFVEEDETPIARLRPTGYDDEVEVLWWSHRDKWEQIEDQQILVALDPDVAAVFGNAETVNRVLRALIETMPPTSAEAA